MKYPIFLFALLLLLSACPASSRKADQEGLQHQEARISTIYLLRHAEKDLTSPGVDKRNPPLSAEGQARAQQLRHNLKDAGIDRIFSSDYIRTRTTVQPLAELLGLEIEGYNAKELPPFAEQLKELSGNILVSGHSNTTPKLVKLLGGAPGPAIKEKTEFDRLYVLTLREGKLLSAVLTRYGQAPED
ncbi:MAG: phosphoglycerate mutase family protein [Bacteroidota bacterium]